MNLKGKNTWILLIVGGLLAVVCLFTVVGGGLGRLFGGGNNRSGGDITGSRQLPNTGSSRTLPGRGTSDSDLGRMYTAVNVDNSGCPADTTSQFYSDETVYVGLQESYIPQGTDMFMRLYYEGQPVEDTDPIVADRDLQSCVWFQFDPDRGGLSPGDYQAELIVNGNPVDSIGFQVAGGTGGLSNTGGGSVQLGQVVTTNQVDQSGCPSEAVYEYYSEEPVYLSVTPSYIPRGTEIFARLTYEGQPVEDTDPIIAEQDLETCVWFGFEPAGFSGGFERGNYEAELYVNGQLAEVIQFTVR